MRMAEFGRYAGLVLVLMCGACWAGNIEIDGWGGGDWRSYAEWDDPNDPNYVMVNGNWWQSGGQLGAGTFFHLGLFN